MSHETRIKALEAIHSILSTSSDLINTLNETAEYITAPEGVVLIEYITTVVETQASLIKLLAEGQMELTDQIDDIVKTYMQ